MRRVVPGLQPAGRRTSARGWVRRLRPGRHATEAAMASAGHALSSFAHDGPDTYGKVPWTGAT